MLDECVVRLCVVNNVNRNSQAPNPHNPADQNLRNHLHPKRPIYIKTPYIFENHRRPMGRKREEDEEGGGGEGEGGVGEGGGEGEREGEEVGEGEGGYEESLGI